MFRVKQKEAEIELFDSHCHLNFPIFDKQRDTLLQQMQTQGIKNVLIPGVSKESWRFIRQLTALKKGVHCAVGLHPMFMHEHRKGHLHDLEMAVAVKPLAAVGEIGLDFYNKDFDRKAQITLFKAQIEIAKTAKLPVILHVRKAHEDVLLYLESLKFDQGGIVHAFNGSLQQAERYRGLGFKLGFGGTITFERSVKLRQLAKSLQLSDIVLETDAPDMKPATSQAQYNSPLNLIDNFEALAALREEDAKEVAQVTTQNAKQVLRIS